jgi:hypothetical protein
MTPQTLECPTKQSVVAYLAKRGLLEIWDRGRGAGSVELDLGVGGFRHHEGSGIGLDEWRLASSPRHLSDVAGRWCAGRMKTYLHRAGILADLWRREGYDPVLYLACRDVFAPRSLAAAGSPGHWYADLVEYLPGLLPNGEPFRSTGHWNPEPQIEIFQTLLGEVAILTAGTTPDGEPYLTERVCGPGDLCIAPPGSWHITYALAGPAVVFNIYTERGMSDHEVRDWVSRKYEGREPVELGLLQEREDCRLVFSEQGLREWGAASRAAEPAVVRDLGAGLFPAGSSLAAAYLFSPAEELARLSDRVWRRWHTGSE